ncbi:MAG: proton-conducting transporter membrane subunit [Luteolibacter sp.]
MTALPLFLSLLVPMGAAVAQTLLLGHSRAQRVVAVCATGVLMLVGAALVATVKSQGPVILDVGNWAAPVGIRLQADMLSALMVAITGLIGFCGAIHGLAEIPPADERRGYHPLYQFLLFGVVGSFLTNDLFNLYVWFEVMLLSSFVLLALGGGKAQTEGAVKYVVLNIVASLVFLVGAGLLYGTLGTLNFTDIAQRIASGQGSTTGIRLSAVFLLLAFAVKAGVFPLYAWLPSSYHTPRHTISAVFAGLLTKVGVYALIRTFGPAFHTQQDFVFPVLLWVSLLTMITGVLGAASQFHTRRILSFHIISQIGYMTLGLALGTVGAMAAAIFYVLHHILVKTNLFFAASAIDRIGGGEDLKKTGGLYRSAPWLAVLFLIPALSLGGIPPFSGFWAKLALLKETLHLNAWLAAGVSLAVGILTLFSMTKIWAEAFWKDRLKTATLIRPILPGHVIPMVLLAAGTIAISVYPSWLFELAEIAAGQLFTPTVP